MSQNSSTPNVTSLADLFALAYQIEADAVDRYKLPADEMETHNNPELVKVFEDLATTMPSQLLVSGREFQHDSGRQHNLFSKVGH